MRFLETVKQPPDVIALQELVFAPATVGRAAARAHFLGYRFIFPPPEPSNDGKLHGARWLVKNTLATIALGNYSDSGGSACLVELQGLVLTSFWRSPSTDDFADLWHYVESARLAAYQRNQAFVIIGDWNLTPNENSFAWA